MRESVQVTVTNHGQRHLASSGSPWEPRVGFSRAARIGALIAVSGTIGLEPDGTLAPGIGDQARRALAIIVAAIEALGGSASDIVRTRIYVTDISRWEEVGAAHAEALGAIRPASTMVEVPRLITPEALVEIEAEALAREAPAE